MPAFDINDPEMDPMCAQGKLTWGSTAYKGHFDQTGVFTGSVSIRERANCVSTMDHSWGPRAERGTPSISWLHAHFSKDLSIHCIFGFDPARDNDRDLWLAHDYVLENGKVFGLKAGTGQTVRIQERYPDTIVLQLIDSADRSWVLNGQALTTLPRQAWSNMVVFNSLCQWDCNGVKGYGEVQDCFELPNLTVLNSAAPTRRLSHPL
ncbi:MAG: hypothetical protein K0Q43_3108 [Ramlibacter sp.]|jgi:hypothetical protein|nr:hypothetical protein [Ramlibacter sp.]